MIRIAIAGTCGFAYILASEIVQTANVVIVLSRQVRKPYHLGLCYTNRTQGCPEFEQNLGVQTAVVNYASVDELQYTLLGIDLVISTIAGDEQLNLINAARRAHVRTFVPSEFEGGIGHRPTPDPLDCGSEAAMKLLLRYSQSGSNRMGYTIFSCGVFYERFGPGGLGLYNICAGSNDQIPGNFLVDVEASTAEIIVHDAQGRPIEVSMTSVYDFARFIAAAINIGPTEWPTEFKMRGDQMSVRNIVAACSNVRGGTSLFTNRIIFSLFGRRIADPQYSSHQSGSSPIQGLTSSHRLQSRSGGLESLVLPPTTSYDCQRSIQLPSS
jgi:hypothetical protein